MSVCTDGHPAFFMHSWRIMESFLLFWKITGFSILLGRCNIIEKESMAGRLRKTGGDAGCIVCTYKNLIS